MTRPSGTPATRRRSSRVVAATFAVSSLLVLAGCGSDGSTATAPTSGSTAAAADRSGTTSTAVTAVSMRGERYCEVLLVDVVEGQASAEVYNSYPLNDCPEEQWAALDAAAIAAAAGTTTAVLNGPRFWLMDQVRKEGGAASLPKEDFGGIEMYLQATVQVGSLAGAGEPYVPREVSRSTVFTFDAGQTVYELTTSDGSTYVMQTWSQQEDPTLAEADLAGLGSRLQLPAGWTYAARVLDQPLDVVTVDVPARVLQDDLGNSYSFVA